MVRTRGVTVKDRRWDTDERGRGVAGGSAFASGVEELVEALALEDWIAEEPEAHLLPHIERACTLAGLELLEHRLEDAVFTVRIAWPGPRRGDEARAAIFAVVGSFAESATSVRQRGLSFEVATGMLDPDTPFKSHGHLVRLELVPEE
jgi:hypothetical protein